MTALLPRTAPFSADEIDRLNALVARSTPQQRSWLSGFLAGVDAAALAQGQPQIAAPRPREKLLILYGSETGNAESLALKAKKTAARSGFEVRVLDMADASPAVLVAARNLIVIASTWGEGDPPQRAAEFYRRLMGDDAQPLPDVRFAVLALGDAAYANFCATGRSIDERLAALGATRAVPRLELDLDFAKKAAVWIDTALAALAPDDAAGPSATVVHVDFKAGAPATELEESGFDADRPLAAEIIDIVNLNGSGSSSETWHIELATGAPGFTYEPGDAIGLLPRNDSALVADLMETVGLGGDEALAAKLVSDLDVTTLTRPVVEAYARLTGRSDVAALVEPERFAAYAAGRQIIDLVAEHREALTVEQLIGLLRPLPPRLYSVASSLKAHAGETHLLVGAVRWQSHGRVRKGVASTWLAGASQGDVVPLYVKPNRHFRLPGDSARPVVMIGAGTGIAPFRAFVEERAESGAKGRNWLFFGARNYTTDFLYQLEWQDHLASGALSRIDVAFSRDQPEKIYVQHRLLERADELRGWIDDGAHLYVCGDEKSMARDVEAALVRILGKGDGDEDRGRACLEDLRRNGCYQRDVY